MMEIASYAWPYASYKISEAYKRCFGVYVQAETTLGPIRGIEQQSQFGYKYSGFQGIPYAKPPIGDLRYKVSDHILIKCNS